MERRRFSREFKLEAVRLIKERGVLYTQASHDLSMHQSQLRSWVSSNAGPASRPPRASRPQSASGAVLAWSPALQPSRGP
jgi:transposase-like protein